MSYEPLTDDQKQAWRELFEHYLADGSESWPVHLVTVNRYGARFGVSPIFDDDDDAPVH